MKRGAVLDGYRVVTEPSNANAGMSQWARAERDGHDYFIKRYLAPKYPVPGSPGTAEGHAKRRRECEAFEARHLTIMDRLRNDVPGAGHLVTPLSFFRSGPSYYKVTDLVAVDEGLSLDDCDPDDVAVAIRSLLTSVRVVHNAGVVHSDLKPDNVLFERTARGLLTCKLIDFDEAYLTGDPPEFVRLAGDPFFYSPEMLGYIKQLDVVGASDLTIASDVFALGVLVHLLITGDAPETDDQYAYPCEAVRDGRRPQIHPALGTGGVAVALGATQSLNPTSRPSVDELLAALTRSALAEAVERVRSRASAQSAPEVELESASDLVTEEPTTPEPAPEPKTGSEPDDKATAVEDPDDPLTEPDSPSADIAPDSVPGPRLRSNMGRQTPPRT